MILLLILLNFLLRKASHTFMFCDTPHYLLSLKNKDITREIYHNCTRVINSKFRCHILYDIGKKDHIFIIAASILNPRLETGSHICWELPQ